MAYIQITQVRSKGRDRYKVRVREKLNKEQRIKYEKSEDSKSGLFDTEEEANSFATHAKSELERRYSFFPTTPLLYTNRQESPISPYASVGEILELFKVHYEASETRQFGKTYISNINRLCGYDLAHNKPSALDYKKLLDFCSERKAEGASPSTIAGDLSALSSVLDEMKDLHPDLRYEMGHILPFRITLHKRGFIGNSNERNRRLEKGEYELLKSGLGEKSTRSKNTSDYRDVFDLLILTCFRLSELLTLNIEDINFDNEKMRVNKGVSSNRHKKLYSREAPITDEMVPLLKRRIKQIGKNKGPLFDVKPGTFSKAFREVVKSKNIEDLRVHDLRTEGVSRRFEQGLDIAAVKYFTGHRDVGVLLRIYTHVNVGESIKRLNRMQVDARSMEVAA